MNKETFDRNTLDSAATFDLTPFARIMSDVEDDSRQQSPAGDARADSPIDDDMSDKDSDQLSEVDVDDLEDYDPLKANIETRPVEIDEDVARTLKVTKRKRTDGETAKKPKEGRRQKKRRTDMDDEVSAADGTIIEGKRRRGGGGEAGTGEKKSRPRTTAKAPSEPDVNEEDLTPEQRRARAIEKAMDAAMKAKSNKRRTKKDEVVGFSNDFMSQPSSIYANKIDRT